MIVQAVAAGARIGEISCPTRYNADASNINFRRSTKYGIGVLQTALAYRLSQSGLMAPPRFIAATTKLPSGRASRHHPDQQAADARRAAAAGR